MKYTTFFFSASVFVRRFIAGVVYWTPRVMGAWVWLVAMVGLLLVYLGYEAFESGRLFRAQFDYGYEFGTETFLCPLTCGVACELEVSASVPSDFFMCNYEPLLSLKESGHISEVEWDALKSGRIPSLAVDELVRQLPWSRLRKLMQELGIKSKTKAAAYALLGDLEHSAIAEALTVV